MSDEGTQKAVYKDEQTQQMLNTPLKDDAGLDEDERTFLHKVLDLIKENTIDLFKPETLVNKVVYDTLGGEKKSKVDFDAVNLLTKIRQIKDLHDNEFDDSYQMKNLVHGVKQTKENLEEEGGDLFII